MLRDVIISLLPGPTGRFVKFLFFSILVCGSSRPYFKKIVKVTDMAIIVFNGSWAARPLGPLWVLPIPPLTTNPLFDEEHLPPVPPVLACREPILSGCHKPDQWYYDDLNSLPLYFEMCKHDDYGFIRCKLDISDLSNLSLVPVADIDRRTPRTNSGMDRYRSAAYRICEDRPVNVFYTYPSLTSSGTTVGSPTTDVNMTHFAKYIYPSTIYSFCPASGRLVWRPDDQDDPYWGSIAIFDFL